MAGLLAPGRIEADDAAEAMRELAAIGEEMSELDQDEIVWRAYGREILARERRWKPPQDAGTLADAFLTPDGDRLIDVLRVALGDAMRRRRALVLRKMAAGSGAKRQPTSSEPSRRRERS